ncbi:MAG TPA: hypothetical protein ENG42_02145 [Candidatus Aenigmarchaeota archaeon]|nr:hypothetical protein [Candidatus Aenigmarchaeota archaeon]
MMCMYESEILSLAKKRLSENAGICVHDVMEIFEKAGVKKDNMLKNASTVLSRLVKSGNLVKAFEKETCHYQPNLKHTVYVFNKDLSETKQQRRSLDANKKILQLESEIQSLKQEIERLKTANTILKEMLKDEMRRNLQR